MAEKPKTCPLCGTLLEYRAGSSFRGAWWQCPAPFVWSTTYKSTMITHYTFDENEEFAAEYMYIPPFRVKNVKDYSVIHKLTTENLGDSARIKEIERTITITGSNIIPFTYWMYVAEIPLIKPEASQKMIDRIKVLLNFL